MVLAAQIALLGLTLVLAVVLRGPRRPALALATLMVPVVLTAPESVERLVDAARLDAARSPRAAALVAPAAVREGRNVPLLEEAERRIPWGSDYGIVRGRPIEGLPADQTRVRSQGVAWMQFRLAPRVAKRGPDAPWVLIFDSTPVREGIEARRAWSFDGDWLVQR